jgi:hypothetical protein
MDRGWLWEFAVQPNECQFFELSVEGHATLKAGMYQLFGVDDRCVNHTIPVPDICEEVRQAPQQWSWSMEGVGNDTEGCHNEPLFLQNMCHDMCESTENTEWSIEFSQSVYDDETDTTVFEWTVSTSISLPENACSMIEVPAALTDVTIRMGCDCAPQSDTFLRSITDHMIPSGLAYNNYWHFDHLDVKPGESMKLQIVLKGDMRSEGFGDVTLAGGDHRCVSTLTSETTIMVPNVCENPCNFGEWSPWQLQGGCSVECGGGEQVRMRTCMSVCGEGVLVDNCPGEAYGTVPCNTHSCPIWMRSDSSSESSSDSSSSSSSSSQNNDGHH